MALIKLFPQKQLLNRIRANDRSVLGELFVTHEQMVKSYIATHGGTAADAQDMLQEAIIVVWQNACKDGFALTCKVSTYIMAIVKNKWRSEKRSRTRLSTDESLSERPDPDQSSLDAMIMEEEASGVRRALDKLGSPCKELLLLYYFEHRDMKSIGKILGFGNADVVKSKKYQCKQRLQAILAQILVETESLE